MAISNNPESTSTNGTSPSGFSSSSSSSPRIATIVVGTFRSPVLYTLTLESASNCSSSSSSNTDTSSSSSSSSSSLTVSHKSAAVGGHSWLAVSPFKKNLYTTCWTTPPTVAAYSIISPNVDPDAGPAAAGAAAAAAAAAKHAPSLTLLNTAPVASLSGYVAVTPSGRHLLSVGGPTGEVFRLDPTTGRLGPLVQTLNFREDGAADDGKREGVAHGGFGGLRWGSHSVDVAPDGKAVYVADIGHNCIWTYHLNDDDDDDDDANEDEKKKEEKEVLTLGTKHISPRKHDGPRHAWPHPNGRVLYVVQEHSSMVDAFSVSADGVTLAHLEPGVTILPENQKCEDFWADEVRTSNLFTYNNTNREQQVTNGDVNSFPSSAATKEKRSAQQPPPRYVYASTRGLEPHTKGYVAAYELDPDGRIKGPALEIYQTRTSGGLANAIEPAPAEVSRRLLGGQQQEGEEECIALTDSEQGWVVILAWNGKRFREVAAVRLEGGEELQKGEVVQAATAVWL